ncbi:MAG: hypothetical protein ACI83O_000030 [Patescibacteria group bacterium]|jgi:hypothetical protein
MELSIIFIITLLTTFLVVRVAAHKFHDMKGYGIKNEMSKTLTGYLRKKLKFNIHHFHIGLLLFIIIVIIIYLTSLNPKTVVPLAISISLIADQVMPIINRKKCYFNRKQLQDSIAIHLLIALIASQVL